MNGLGLFAGIGGLELGLHRAIPGYRTICHVERDAYAAATLVARMVEKTLGEAPIHDDVSTFDGKPWRGVVDLVSGGFPCQDISLAGAGAGLDGERSGLWSEYARIVREVRPRYVFVENVAALASRGLDRVLGDLAEGGYDAEWDLFRAEQVGAPHRRERLFILAERASDPERDAVWGEPERGSGRAQEPDRRHSEPRHLGEELADSDGERLQGRKRLRELSPNERCSGELGEELGDAHAEPRKRGEELADCGRQRLEGQLSAGSAPRSTRRGGGAEVGDAPSERGGPQVARGREAERTPARGAGGELGDANCGRCEGERVEERAGERSASGHEPDRHDSHGRFGWPPGPGDTEGWRAYLAAGGPEPSIRRSPDGVSSGLEFRADRLRCLGNGVVPQVAELAWRTLIARLEGT